MDYEISCPKGHKLRVTEAHFGQQVNCPTCGESFVVPNMASGPEEAPQTPGTMPAVAVGASMARRRSSRHSPSFKTVTLAVGRPLLALGLLVVLLSRGCDAIGRRGVARAKAKAASARAEFQYRCEDRLKDYEDHEEVEDFLRDLRRESRYGGARAKEVARAYPEPARGEEDEPARGKSKEQADVEKQLEELQKDKESLEKGEWRRLDHAASQASAKNDMGGFWREIFFMIGTILLAGGLLTVSWNAEGAERAVCLVMLAILAFSIYIAGVAWLWSTIPTPG